jgi:hypothetical protein
MACIDTEFCNRCKKITEHVSYDDSFHGPTGCLVCIENVKKENEQEWESKNINQKLDLIRQVLINHGLM